MAHAAGRVGSGRKSTKNNLEASRDLQSREEEYKRLNEELEAKTANLVRQAEEMMRGQEHILSQQPSLLENINADEFLKNWDEDLNDNGERKNEARPATKNSNRNRATSGNTSSRRKLKSKSNVADDVATAGDDFMSDYSLTKTISNIEGKLDKRELPPGGDDEDDDVMPTVAQDMGTEAQLRFLKAKLRVMQEEVDRLAAECNKKDEESSKLVSRIKVLEDDKIVLNRTNSAHQSQLDKYKKLAEDLKAKTDSLENQIYSLRKELDGLKRSQKQQTTNQGATEVRLNRALEEVEKYKAELQKTKSTSKDKVEGEKKRMEQLLADNKRLEKQKNELISGFKKQLKLIDVLKRQKMHIEAAKMLEFSEEEFVKALEWGP